MEYAKCKNALYYDLLVIPHGHIPAPMVRFWSWLPIPVKGLRTYDTFSCPVCGMPSFFKIDYMCRECESWNDGEEYYLHWKSREGKRKKRLKWKAFEYALLPLYILLGKAWYMKSVQYHAIDFMNGRVPNVFPVRRRMKNE